MLFSNELPLPSSHPHLWVLPARLNSREPHCQSETLARKNLLDLISCNIVKLRLFWLERCFVSIDFSFAYSISRSPCPASGISYNDVHKQYKLSVGPHTYTHTHALTWCMLWESDEYATSLPALGVSRLTTSPPSGVSSLKQRSPPVKPSAMLHSSLDASKGPFRYSTLE